MKEVLILCLILTTTFALSIENDEVSFSSADDVGDREAVGACNICSQFIQSAGHAVPFVPIMSSFYHFNMGIIARQTRHHLMKNLKFELSNAFSNALLVLNDVLHQLEDMINDRFNELEGFVDRKQFETDITDPATILWGTATAFLNENRTCEKQMSLLQKECDDQTPWKIVTKIYNRLYGPDNTLITQLRANHYTNLTFMQTKDIIMYRMFQMMTVQSICIGMEFGPDNNVTENWEMRRMGDLYNSVVENIIEIRKRQEKDYFTISLPEIIRQSIAAGGDNQAMVDRLYSQMRENYGWEDFRIEVSDKSCWDRMAFNYNTSRDNYIYDGHSYDRLLRIVRFWPKVDFDEDRQAANRKMDDVIVHGGSCNMDDIARRSFPYNQYSQAMFVDWYDKCNPNFRTHQVSVPESVVLNNVWCGGRALNGWHVFGANERPGDIAYDLGFWERPQPLLNSDEGGSTIVTGESAVTVNI